MHSISVIIVEDEAMTARFMETMLQRKGFKVLKRVSSGEEAVDTALMLKPDLVIMDIRLAGKMDGIEAVIKIMSESPDDIHFLFTTGYSDIELKEQALRLNPIGFFIKPVNLTELVDAVESFFLKQRE